MFAKPPPIPELVYQRVMLVGKIDGYLILMSAGMLALFFAPSGFYVFTIASCLAAGTGAMEVHGARLLSRGDEGGVNWLVRAQLLLMFVVVAFVLYYANRFDTEFFNSLIPEIRAQAAETYPRFGLDDPYAKISDSELLMVMRVSINLMLVMLGVVSCVYQGLMARYYHKRRAAIEQALDILYGQDE